MEKNIHEIEIKIDKEEWKEAIDKSFEKASKKVKVDGFRQGKVPRNIFEKKFGVESLYEEAINIVLPNAYDKLFKENKDLVPIVTPSINIKDINENEVVFIFKITTKPEIKIKKYKNLGIEKEKVKVTKKEIDDQIESLRNQYAELEIKEGKIENGDTVVIDFEGFKDGVAFEGGKGENYPLTIGSNTFIPGFEEQLIGLKAEDEKEVLVTFPEEYASEELKGQKAVFKVKVHEVKTKKLPEMNKEFFEDLGYDKVENEEQLRDLIKADLEAKKDYENENKYIDALLEEVSKNTTVQLPEELIHEEAHHMVHNYEEQLKMQGITLDMFYEFTHSDENALIEQMTPEAEKRVKYRFILEEIIELEKIEVTEKEAKEHVKEVSKKYNMTEDDLIKEYGSLDNIIYDLKMQKALDILKK